VSTLGLKPATQHVSTEKQSITGNGGTSYTLQQSVSQASDIEVFVNNTRQEPTVAYTASGTTLTMTGAVNSSDSFYVIFQGIAIQTAGLPVDAAITASTISTSQTITSTGNITTSGTVNTPSINGQQIGGRRNIVINGAMKVAQRGTSQTNIGNSSGGGYFTLDRFNTAFTTSGIFTMTQSTVTDLAGFSNALKVDCTTADTSVAVDEYFLIEQKFEGQDLQQLAYNQSSAKTTTVSFYVKGNASAQYTFALQYHLSGGTARWFTKGFAVTTDWTRVVITIPGDTQASSGSDYGIADDNATGANIMIWLHGGTNFSSGTHQDTAWADRDYTKLFQDNQTSFFDSTDRTFFLTGLQMEVGSQATPFEHRSFGEELALCQRYYCSSYPHGHIVGNTSTGTVLRKLASGQSYDDIANFHFPVEMRAVPTIVLYNPVNGVVNGFRGDSTNYTGAAINTATTRGVNIYKNASVGATVFMSIHATASAEL